MDNIEGFFRLVSSRNDAQTQCQVIRICMNYKMEECLKNYFKFFTLKLSHIQIPSFSMICKIVNLERV